MVTPAASSSRTTNYRKGAYLGKGQWGQVYEAFFKPADTQEERRVAIKRIKPIEEEHLPPGINFTAIREVKYMRMLRGSKYIVEV